MENNLKFNSAICTSRVQSERLLSLGIKKETADMTHHYLHSTDSYELKDIEFSRIMHLQELVNKKPVLGRNGDDLYAKDIPAWSLHRLIDIVPSTINKMLWFTITPYTALYDSVDYIKSFDSKDNLYDNIIDCIEWLIEEGYFNKEYLDGLDC